MRTRHHCSTPSRYVHSRSTPRPASLIYERDLAPSRFSIAAGPSIKFNGASGDYDSYTVGVAGELRWWLRLGAPWSGLSKRTMIGPYVSARLSTALTSMRDVRESRELGRSLSLMPGVAIGYRLAFFRHLELSAALGPAVVFDVDLDGRLPTAIVPTMAYGLSVGWMF